MKTENPEKRFRIAKETAKDRIRSVFKTHGLRTVEYKKIEALNYEQEVTLLGQNILLYVVSESSESEKEEKAQLFCKGCEFDFENIIK